MTSPTPDIPLHCWRHKVDQCLILSQDCAAIPNAHSKGVPVSQASSVGGTMMAAPQLTLARAALQARQQCAIRCVWKLPVNHNELAALDQSARSCQAVPICLLSNDRQSRLLWALKSKHEAELTYPRHRTLHVPVPFKACCRKASSSALALPFIKSCPWQSWVVSEPKGTQNNQEH